MLVSCAKCKSPVFVSSAVVAMGEAEVGCSSCGTRLKVSSSGQSSVVGVPAPVIDLSSLPSYEGGAANVAPAPQEVAGAAASSSPPGSTAAVTELASVSARPETPPTPAAPLARPPDLPPTRRGPRGSAGQLPSFLSAVPLSAVLSEGLSGMPTASGAAGALARAPSDPAPGGFGSAPTAAPPWGSTASTPWPPAAPAPAAATPAAATSAAATPAAATSAAATPAAATPAAATPAAATPAAATPPAATPSVPAPAGAADRVPGPESMTTRGEVPPASTTRGEPAPEPPATRSETSSPSVSARRGAAPQIVLAAPRSSAGESPVAAAVEASRVTVEQPRVAPESPRAAADPSRPAPEPAVAAVQLPRALAEPPRAVAGAARTALASVGEPTTLFPPVRPGAQRIPVSRRPFGPTSSGPAWRPLAFAGLGVTAALVLAGGLWFAGARADRSAKASAAALPSAPPGSALGHYRQANQLIADHKPVEAVDELHRTLELEPGFGLAYRSLGVAYMLLGRERSAVEAYERFAAMEPAHADAEAAKRIAEAYRHRTAAAAP